MSNTNPKPRAAKVPEMKRQAALELLRQKPPPAINHVAKTVGITWQAAKRLSDELATAAEKTLETYGREFATALPPSERVRLYAAIARGEVKAAYSQLKALQRMEELEGIVTARESKEEQQQVQQPPALFQLPAGTQVAWSIKGVAGAEGTAPEVVEGAKVHSDNPKSLQAAESKEKGR